MNDRYVLRSLSSLHSYSAGFVRPVWLYAGAYGWYKPAVWAVELESRFVPLRNRWGTHRVPAGTRWVPLYLPPLKAFWAARFISNRAYNLYIYPNRFIYKLKMIYIQNENDIYTNRKSFIYKSWFDLWKNESRPERPGFPISSASVSALSQVLIETFARRLVCILFINSLYNRELFCIFEY